MKFKIGHTLTRVVMTVLLTVAGLTQASAGATWIGNSYINVNGTWYNGSGNGDWATGGAFHNHNFGNITATSITIGGQIQVHATNNENWETGVCPMHYSIDNGSWVELMLTKYSYANNNMIYQSGGSNFASETIDISGLSVGVHTISIYFGPLDGNYDSNTNSQNYVATFTKGIYAINTDIFGSGTVTVKNGNDVVTSATAGTELTVILEAGTGYIVNGANIDNVSINYNTFDRQTDSYWVGTITMPESDITIKPDFVKPYANLSVRSASGKYTINTACTMVTTRSGYQLGVEIGTTVTLTVMAETDYAIESVAAQKYDSGIYTDLALTDNGNGTWSFTMPEEDVTVGVSYYKTSGTYNINVGTVDGTIQFYNADYDPIKKADAGETVTVNAMPANAASSSMMTNEVYTIVTVTDSDGQSVEVTRSSGGYYGETISFTMPAKAVTVSAEFKNSISMGSGMVASHGTGTITVGGETRSYADENEVVTCTLTPDEGYVLADFIAGYRDQQTGYVYLTCTKTAENTYTFTMPNKSVFVSPVFAKPLANDSDNGTAISNISYGTTVMLSDRTLYKDNSWNTICLPFDVMVDNVYMSSILDGATVMELNTTTSGFDSSTGTLTLNFSELEETSSYMGTYKTLTAGKPYIIKWASGEDIVNPYFNNQSNTTATTPTTVTSNDGKVSFVGTFGPALLTKNTTSNLYLGEDNTLYYPTTDNFYVNAFRAYFTVDLGSTPVRAFNLNFGDEETTTGIQQMEDVRGKMSDEWFTLDGKKLVGKPAEKGLYINNGRKVVIK